MKLRSQVARVAPAPSPDALTYFQCRFAFETDCSDVHHALETGRQDFILLDVRSRDVFLDGHVPGATHLPYVELTEARLAEYDPDALFVVYCSGPHCNGAARAAVRLATLGRPVKEMIGGIAGWKDEGFELTR